LQAIKMLNHLLIVRMRNVTTTYSEIY